MGDIFAREFAVVRAAVVRARVCAVVI